MIRNRLGHARVTPALSLVTLLCVGAASACALPGRALTPQRIFERTAPSVVRIDSQMPDGAAVGTGFAVGDTQIATNLHVIDGAERVIVQFQDGSRAVVQRVVAFDEGKDLAIVETTARGLAPLPFGDSDALAKGERIYAIGSPLGLDYTITDGLFSGRRRLSDEDTIDLLQVSVPLSPGSSGGPLLNDRGQVIGVATRTFVRQAYGLGVPSNALRTLTASADQGASFREFAAERGRRRALLEAQGSPRSRQIPSHPLELVAACPEADLRTLALEIVGAISRGAPAYNAGSPEDCYRIYEGAALRLTRDLAASCPGGSGALAKGLDQAGTLASFDDKAWAMRDAFDGLLDVIRRYIETQDR